MRTVLFLNSIIKPRLHIYKQFFTHSTSNMAIDIGGMRTSYKGKSEVFIEDDIPVKEPFNQFKIWFDEVCNNPKIIEPNAMCLATATKDGVPSARFVLLKGYGKEGFKFFTHYTSRKGIELEENPAAALTFYWDVYNRSVRVEGIVKKLDMKEADKYFNSRPRQSQIGALASNQSNPIKNRNVLCANEQKISEEYKDCPIPRPPKWGGYILIPHSVEFWQGQTDRLHDRIKFRKPKEGENADGVLLHKGEDGWVYERLAP